MSVDFATSLKKVFEWHCSRTVRWRYSFFSGISYIFKQVEEIWSKELLTCIYQGLKKKDGSLHQFCKEQLPQKIAETMKEDSVGPDFQYTFLFQMMKR